MLKNATLKHVSKIDITLLLSTVFPQLILSRITLFQVKGQGSKQSSRVTCQSEKGSEDAQQCSLSYAKNALIF